MLEDLGDDNGDLCHASPCDIIPENGFYGGQEQGYMEDFQPARIERAGANCPSVTSSSASFKFPNSSAVDTFVQTPTITGSSGFCLTCGGFFLRLDRHYLTHTDERPFPCQECSVRFRQRCHLLRHIASKHQRTNCFPCPYCKKILTRKDKLKHHMLRTCKVLREF